MAISTAFEQRQRCTWMCFVGNNKKWKGSPLYKTIEVDGKEVTLSVNRKEAVANAWLIDFEWNNSEMTFADVIQHFGVIPLPPYLNRSAVDSDKER